MTRSIVTPVRTIQHVSAQRVHRQIGESGPGRSWRARERSETRTRIRSNTLQPGSSTPHFRTGHGVAASPKVVPDMAQQGSRLQYRTWQKCKGNATAVST
eukprot:143984-Rhodomonas_salina.2